MTAIGLALILIIPRDPKNTAFLGLSPVRLAMLAVMAATLALFVGLFSLFQSRPALSRQASQRLAVFLAPVWRRHLILLLAGMSLLAGPYLAAQIALTTDDQVKQVLLRLLPFALLTAGAGWEALRSDYLGEERRRWQMGLLAGAAYLVLTVLAQAWLLTWVERRVPVDAAVITASRLVAALLALLYFGRLLAASPVERRTWLLVLLLVAILYGLQWAVWPHKYWPAQSMFAMWAPALILGLACLAALLMDAWRLLPASAQPRILTALKIGAALALLLLVIPYVQADIQHAIKLNYAPIFTDQDAYLTFARNARLANFNYTGDHNRMPGYPFLQGLFYRPGMDDAAFFWQGKMINIGLSILLLGLLLWVFSRYMSSLEAMLLTGVIAFSLYIFKAPYFQAEILFYFLFCLLYIFLIRMLQKPTLKLAAATGAVAGLAHLVKASVPPALALFGGVYLVKELAGWIRLLRSADRPREQVNSGLRRLAAGGLVVVCFLAVIFPYIRAMKAQFGSYFYNVNTSIYIWYDDNFQATDAEDIYHFTQGIPAQLSPDQIPSLRNYMRTHTLAQILSRVEYGLREQANNILSPFSVTAFHLSLLAFLILAVLADPGAVKDLVQRNRYVVLFACLFFIGYLATFVWYSPISPERRFTYGLYIPLLFSIGVSLRSLAKAAKGWIDPALFNRASYIILAAVLVANIYLVLTERIYFDRFGS
jgi:hypothetical protein